MLRRLIQARRAVTVFAAVGGIALLGGAVDLAGAAFPGGNGKIAFSTNRDGNTEIYVMNADGSDETNLTQHPSFDIDPEWSPDGSRIAFATGRHGASNAEIYVVNADGSGLKRLTNNTLHDFEPAWSPDGSKIAFSSGGELFVVNADGSGLSQLIDGPPFARRPSWSPDGSRITFDGNPGIYVIDVDSSAVTALTQGLPDYAPDWSPDGSKIAFASYRDGNGEIYVMNTDGSGQVNVSQKPATYEDFPEWSPDGTMIAFHRTDPSYSDYNVLLMNADGSGVTQLTESPAPDWNPSWQTVPSADLAVSLGATPDVARSGKPLTYVITVQNAGPSNAHGVVVTDTLPEGARFVSAQPSKGTCVTPAPGATGTITCSLGFLPNTTNATTQIVVKVVVKKTTITNTASVSSVTPDPSLANNSATIATQVR